MVCRVLLTGYGSWLIFISYTTIFLVNFNPFEKEKTDENFAVRATRARIAEVTNVLALNY